MLDQFIRAAEKQIAMLEAKAAAAPKPDLDMVGHRCREKINALTRLIDGLREDQAAATSGSTSKAQRS